VYWTGYSVVLSKVVHLPDGDMSVHCYLGEQRSQSKKQHIHIHTNNIHTHTHTRIHTHTHTHTHRQTTNADTHTHTHTHTRTHTNMKRVSKESNEMEEIYGNGLRRIVSVRMSYGITKKKQNKHHKQTDVHVEGHTQTQTHIHIPQRDGNHRERTQLKRRWYQRERSPCSPLKISHVHCVGHSVLRRLPSQQRKDETPQSHMIHRPPGGSHCHA
jgi:hypothetical protein